MDRALIRNSVGLDMTPATAEEYKRIAKSFEGQDEPDDYDELTPEQFKKYIQYTLLKLLRSPKWIRGYVENVKKTMEVESGDKDALEMIKEEVEQTMSEIISVAAKKYNVVLDRKFYKNK